MRWKDQYLVLVMIEKEALSWNIKYIYMSYINLNILHFLFAKFSLTLIVDLSDSTWLNVPHLHARKKPTKQRAQKTMKQL